MSSKAVKQSDCLNRVVEEKSKNEIGKSRVGKVDEKNTVRWVQDVECMMVNRRHEHINPEQP